MKISHYQQELKTADIIRKLHEKGYTDTDGKSYRELKHRLAVLMALDVNIDKPENKYF